MRTIRPLNNQSFLSKSAPSTNKNAHTTASNDLSEERQSSTTELPNVTSTEGMRSGLQESADFDANQIEFLNTYPTTPGKRITGPPQSQTGARAVGITDTINETIDYITDPCNFSSNPLRKKRNNCSDATFKETTGDLPRGLNRPTSLNSITGSPEIQNIANNIRSSRSDTQKIRLMLQAMTVEKYLRKNDAVTLMQHPFVKNPSGASTNDKKDFINDVKKAVNLMDFQKNHADVWHANSQAKMDRAFDFSHGTPVENLYELVQVADIEPLIELSQIMKDKLTESMDVAIRNGASPKLTAGVVGSLDTMIDVLLPTNIVDLPAASKLLGKTVSEVGHLAKSRSSATNKNLIELAKIRHDMKSLVKQSRTPHGINSDALEELLSYTIGKSAAYKGMVTIDELRRSHRAQ